MLILKKIHNHPKATKKNLMILLLRLGLKTIVIVRAALLRRWNHHIMVQDFLRPIRSRRGDIAGHQVRIMAPKKKQKTMRSFEDVPEVQIALDQWVTSVYALRHNVEGDVKSHAWPVEHGGTFLEIASRASQDEDRLVTAAHRLCQKAGVINDDLTVQGFKDSFMTMQAGLANRNTMFKLVAAI